ncbi:MFS transporter [Aestuariivirga litoralis]|uniref:MFS transporter n=2 Tax=Aestuariivirga litoralis TaxID=2650924 RepID=A0A2W2BKL3_9HYPH|nr:MFS transporter [Aestuariivirga litoralis]
MVLAASQAIFGATSTALVVTSGLIGSTLAPSASWATLPMALSIVGTALTTFPISLMMRRVGRRVGFVLCALAGAAGAFIGAWAIFERSFGLFLLGCLVSGIYQASASYYRFAAADTASPAFRPKAISWVMTGGIVAALVGTFMVMATTNLFAPVTFAGTWVVMGLLALAGAGLLLFVDIPLTQKHDAPSGRPLGTIARQPRYIVAAMTAMLAFGIMVLVMTATPVAMLGCGFSVKDSSWVIQWHALAMFVPSFFTGSLIQRFGAEKISAIGMLLLVGAAVSGLLGIHFENFAIGLILLGLGWNFGYIGGTTMLTETYEPDEKNKAQGLNDFLVFTTTAVTSLLAGKLLAWFGWEGVNYAVFPMVVLALVMIVWLARHPYGKVVKAA